MPETAHQDVEEGIGPDTQSTSNQRGKSNFGDSSGPLFSIYSKAAEEEDNKMVERWQKDADGILIFTGLFSAAVAALLAVTVQDLRPNSQDTSAFYLGNIYQVLADPNVTRPSIPTPVAKPPRFTPPRYAVLVNSLWFLSLVMSLSCALLATSLHQWARRYLRLAQPARCSPEKQARMRAFFANGVERMHVPWAVEGLPTLLHLSLFLFFCGLVIFLFKIDHDVYFAVLLWIEFFSGVYGFITILPIIRHDSPYNSPLSTPVWFLNASIRHVAFKILAFIKPGRFWSCRTRRRCKDLRDRYQGWMLGGVEKAAEETVKERSSEINDQILDWTISALGDDDSLKSFFEAIPGFFNSKLVKHLEKDTIPVELRQKFKYAVDVFLGRTWSSNSVDDSEKFRRLDIAMNAMNRIGDAWIIVFNIFFGHWDDVPQTVEMGQTLARWCTSSDQPVAQYAQATIAKILVRAKERNDSWVTLAVRVFGLSERDLRDNIALGGDNVVLAILLRVTRQSLHFDYYNYVVLEALSELDIWNTLPRLQHDFCTLWNKIVREARNKGPNTTPVRILNRIRYLYITFHQGTDAAPTALSASTNLSDPLSYPLCAGHYPDSGSIAQIPVPLPTPPADSPGALSPSLTDAPSTVPQQAKQTDIIAELPSPSNPTKTSEIRNVTPLADPAPSSPCPTDDSPKGDVSTASQGVTSTVTLSHPLEQSEQQDVDIVAPSEPGTSQNLSSASPHVPAQAPIPTPLPNTQSQSFDAGVISVSNSSRFSPPSICSSIPASHPTSITPLPRLRARGLVNTGNICFANAVLQLLVNCPPFWNLLWELGDLKRQHGAGVPGTGRGATPLVDATVRFLKEFIVEEQPSSTQQQSQPATDGTSRVNEEKKDKVVDSFEPTYLYDAMKEKRKLKPLLDGRQQDAEEFLCLYLDALDEEWLVLLASISCRQSASAAPEVEVREVSQSGQTEVASQGLMANFVQSPTMRIFGGKFRSPVRAPNQPDLVSTEDWRSLHLEIQPDSIYTVQDTLAHISHPPSVQVSGSGLGNASQQVLIEALPPVLVLHLNRVRYDAAAGGMMKIVKSIQFAPELEIPLDIMVPNAQRPSDPPHYKLYGVLYHHGESAGCGHYTADVLHSNGDGDTGEIWLHVDNEAASPVRYEDVFGEHGTERAADERCANLLVYCRTSLIGTS